MFNPNKEYNMKAKLIKKEDDFYSLKVDGFVMATSSGMLVDYKLSKENCDEIFGVVDVERLANETFTETNLSLKEYEEGLHIGFKEGFLKAMELNDKLFTLDDMKEAYGRGFLQQGIKSFNSLIQSLQQPTEIDVEIEMETKQQLANGYRNQAENVIGFIAEYENILVPKLDEDGCLILKKNII